jgi:hypothetical protein
VGASQNAKLTFTEIVNEIADRLNLTSDDALNRIGRGVNRHYKRITSSVGLVVARRAVVSATASLGSQYLTFSGIEKVISVYDDSSGSVRVLPEVTFDQLRNQNATTGSPTCYAIARMGSGSVTVFLDCLAQTEFELKADGHETASELSGSQEPSFPESFHDILVEAVLGDELRKLEKSDLAAAADVAAQRLLSDLRMWIAKSGYLNIQQGGAKHLQTGAGVNGGGTAPSGGTSWTQTGLVTFDRDPSAPFAVTSGSATVTNLDADKLDGLDSTAFAQLPIDLAADVSGDLPFSNVAQIATDRLLGRDTAGTGDIETLTVGGGIEFTGSGGIQRSAFSGGDVTGSAGSATLTIANDAVTYAKLQNVSATSRVLGRKTSGAGDTEECTLSEVLDFVGSAAQGDILYRGSSAWARLAAGTNGQFLQTQGAGANPQWASSNAKPFIVFTPAANNPPASAYSTPDTRNAHLVLDFDGSTDEEAVFPGVLPSGYNGGGLTCDIYTAFTSATSGSVRFQAAIERIDTSSLDIDADSFASFQSAGGSAPGTSGQVIKVTITFTDGSQMDSLAAGEAFRLKIRRDADGTSGTDDITTDAEVLRVVVRET